MVGLDLDWIVEGVLGGLAFVAYLQRYKRAVLAANLRGSTQLVALLDGATHVWFRAWLSRWLSNMVCPYFSFLNEVLEVANACSRGT